jgi:hypothetical protein
MQTGEDDIATTGDMDPVTDWTTDATQLLGSVDHEVMAAAARIDPETPLGVSFDAR